MLTGTCAIICTCYIICEILLSCETAAGSCSTFLQMLPLSWGFFLMSFNYETFLDQR